MLYLRCDGSNITSIETIKKLTMDLLNDPHVSSWFDFCSENSSYTERSEVSLEKEINNTERSEIIIKIIKLIKDDIALLKRISRVPDSYGVNVKLFYTSGLYSYYLKFLLIAGISTYSSTRILNFLVFFIL